MQLTLAEVIQRAAAAYRGGAWPEAERLCRLALQAKRDAFDALLMLGTITARTRRSGEAVDVLAAAVAANPRSADAWYVRGMALSDLGQQGEALASFERAIALAPERAQFHNNAGAVLSALGRPAEALTRFERAVALDPSLVETHYNRGNALRALGRAAEAVAAYDRALALDPSIANAHNNRGALLAGLGRPEEALASCERALALAPDYVDAHCNRGRLLQDAGRHAEALASYDAALAHAPRHAGALNNRGTTLRSLGRHDEALASYDRALACAPRDADAHSNRGSVLAALGRYDEALASYDRALALVPDHVEARYNRGNALRDRERYPEAIADYERALAVAPGHVSAAWNRALCQLLQGDFGAGWQGYERRWDTAQQAPYRRRFDVPQWTGTEPLAGRTILLHSEQGLGDTLQFCRYAEHVAALGARVVLEVQPSLTSLMRKLKGAHTVVACGEPLPRFDVHCPLLSLPLALRTDLASIPAGIPYLASDPARVAAWRARLGHQARPRVGLAWSGRTRNATERRRSIPLRDALPMLSADIEWISVQKDLLPEDAEPLAASPQLRHFGDALADFADTAALLELVDLVVTIDTAAAHLAGAMGKPVWLLLATNPDWRWLLHRDDSPWYPTARLFRQAAMGDWPGVVARVRAELPGALATTRI